MADLEHGINKVASYHTGDGGRPGLMRVSLHGSWSLALDVFSSLL